MDFISFLQKTLPILGLIFIAVFLLILLIRMTLLILFHFAKKKYQQLIGNKKRKYEENKPKKHLPKEDEARFIKKAPPTQQYEKLPSTIDQTEEYDVNEVKIVDIVQPVGFWTSMVLGSKLTYLVSSAKLMNQNSKKGFWVSMVEAQARAQGRQRGRSRY